MKKIAMFTAALLLGYSTQAQVKNVTDVTKTTTTTIKDSEGVKQAVKEQKIQEVQDVEVEDADSKALNKNIKQTPVQVTSVTTVTNPDGSTRTVDVDNSAYYENNGQRYDVRLDAAGYTVNAPGWKKPAVLRKTSTNSFIYRGKDKVAIGYFDTNGNLVLETYDDKSDKVTIETLTRVRH
jgi:hypothetical protein